MIKDETYYKHVRTGHFILVVRVFDGKARVLADGVWRTVECSIVEKNYTETEWQEARKN